MVRASPEIMARHGGEEGARARRTRTSSGQNKFWPMVLRTYLPGYTPHDIPFSEAMRELQARYDARAASTSRFEPA